ncbi:PREDICTED: uncharacterized protein LOC107350927 isoform X1 [Acropora digitifera]|uniref:uncharacterized protein LOC107350927 isoform X1 n=1 Tax=Acropora digitifera TaxID=70779 RepID=UPI00077AE449|nr:PREDICTED: uncharacterized protein LOC107350927 isoform X1 [Acropora digitifera]
MCVKLSKFICHSYANYSDRRKIKDHCTQRKTNNIQVRDCWKRKTFFVFESHVYRSVWANWGRYSEKSEFAGRRKRIKSESRSGILDKRQEKAMEKTITKLCLLLAMLHLVGMADGVSIASKVHSSKQPVITYFGLHNATGIAFIGNNINLTCTMENADLGTFLKSVPYPSGVSAQSNNTRLSAQ